MLDPDKTLLLAARVAAEAEKMGIKTALIGAAALAVHGYARGTEDIDLAASVRPLSQLDALARVLRVAWLGTELRYPDDDDRLGGFWWCGIYPMGRASATMWLKSSISSTLDA